MVPTTLSAGHDHSQTLEGESRRDARRSCGPRRLWLGLPTAAILLTACATGHLRDGTYVNSAKGFVVRLPSAGWSVETAGEPDLLLRRASRDAGIVVNGTCGELAADRRLEIAARHLFFGFQGKQILVRERSAVSGQDAVRMVLRGELRNRELLLHGYILKDADCVYDLVLFAAPEDYANVNGDFEALVGSFRLVGGQAR